MSRKIFIDDEIEKKILYALSDPYKNGIITKKLWKKIGSKSSTDQRKSYTVLKRLKKDKKVVVLRVGRNVVNYLPENEELVKGKWGVVEDAGEVKDSDVLKLQISHTKKVQDSVINPLYTRFKKVLYGWELINPKKDEFRRGYAEEGVPYCPVWMDGEGIVIPVTRVVKSLVLLDDFLKYHSPMLSTMIDEFNKKYRENWKIYFKIHDMVKDRIYERMQLPITQYIFSENDASSEKIESVTTNLQYRIAENVICGSIFDIEKIYFPYTVKEQNDMYECYSTREIPEKCYLREKCRSRSIEFFCEETEKKIGEIFTDIKKSKELKRLSNNIQNLRDGLWKLQCEIIRGLERELNKEVLDGFCDYCIHKKEANNGFAPLVGSAPKV